MNTSKVWVGVAISLILSSSAPLPSVWAADGKGIPYKRKDIAESRFGEGKRKELLSKAYNLSAEVAKRVVGQDRAAKALQDRLVQYIEGYGSRTKDPIAMHLIGLPGVGKSSILDALEALGFKVFRVDAQKYVKDGGSGTSVRNLMFQLYSLAANNKEPTIILFDEIDKVAEVTTIDGKPQETTQPLIGMLNEVLTSGKIQDPGSISVDLSNFMFLSAMNLAPGEIEAFTKDTLGSDKSFYEFTVEDFAKFDAWVRSGPHAASLLLSKLFRSNTVSRLVPNSIIVKPLEQADYREIAKITADAAIKAGTQGTNAAKKIQFEFDGNYLDFLQANTVYPPSGARDTVLKANALTEQLIIFGSKARGDDPRSLTQPRKIHATWDPNSNRAILTITPQLRQAKGNILVDGNPFQVPVEYDRDSRSFVRPNSVTNIDPPLPKAGPKIPADQKPITKKQVRETRYPQRSEVVKGLAERLDSTVRGQQLATRAIEENLGIFMGRQGPVEKAPPYLVFSGFPGIGKSELVWRTAKELDLPVVRVNMQEYSSDQDGVVLRLLDDLDKQIRKAQMKRPDQRFIFQVEELDKAYEIEPNGALKNRPAMMVIKDLLNEGIVAREFQSQGNYQIVSADIRNSFVFVTMNFSVDRFGFKADPRLTTIEDVTNAWRRLSATPADLKSIMGAMFLPETVNRLLPHLMVLKPLSKEDYGWILGNQVKVAIGERLLDPKTKRNLGKIEISLTDAYKRYLYSECVIPSEGGRYTAVSSKKKISEDIETALSKLATNKRFGSNPIEMRFDFDPSKSEVGIFVIDKEPKKAADAEPVHLVSKSVMLAFPPIGITGPVPHARLVTAVHEFGHAYSGMRLGMRFEYATAVPPQAGIGGYVKWRKPGQNAQALMSQIYSALGSRAMERIFLSKDPLSRDSFLKIEYGASNDILQATKMLWNLIYEYGLDPHSGVIERMGVEPPSRYAAFPDIPADKVEALGRVLADMEDHVVKDFLRAHSESWYRDHILNFARKGGMTEEEFYAMVEHPFPGENAYNLGIHPEILSKFGEDAVQLPEQVKNAMHFRQGNTATTAHENLHVASQVFSTALQTELHASRAKVETKLGDKPEPKLDHPGPSPCAKVFE